jgi:hypothetical protein
MGIFQIAKVKRVKMTQNVRIRMLKRRGSRGQAKEEPGKGQDIRTLGRGGLKLKLGCSLCIRFEEIFLHLISVVCVSFGGPWKLRSMFWWGRNHLP